MKTALIPYAVVVCAALPAAASVEPPLALSTIIAGLETQGYRVTEVDVDRNSIDVEAVTQDRRRVELRLDPATGEILAETPDN